YTHYVIEYSQGIKIICLRCENRNCKGCYVLILTTIAYENDDAIIVHYIPYDMDKKTHGKKNKFILF
ncbi:hypothetical protein HZS_7724, partial [Henneguya salminicola]